MKTLPAYNIQLNVEKLNSLPLRLGTREDVPCTLPHLNIKIVLEVLSSVISLEKGAKGKIKLFLLVFDYVEISKEYTKKTKMNK